jgi:uncharacterized protein YcfJ
MAGRTFSGAGRVEVRRQAAEAMLQQQREAEAASDASLAGGLQIGGTLLGALIGTMVAPGVGTGIGASLGAGTLAGASLGGSVGSLAGQAATGNVDPAQIGKDVERGTAGLDKFSKLRKLLRQEDAKKAAMVAAGGIDE